MADLLNNDLSDWDPIKLSRYLAPIDIASIEHIKVSGPSYSYRVCGMPDKKGVFLVKSAYWFSKSKIGIDSLESLEFSITRRMRSEIWGVKLCH